VSGVVVWFTGLPSSGKTTLARKVEAALQPTVDAIVLDSDAVRATLTPRPGYDPEGRDNFYETLSALAALLAKEGHVVLVAATGNLAKYRLQARARSPEFLEIFVDTPLTVCQERDSKGLYKNPVTLARLPGMGAPFELPKAPDLVVKPDDAEAAQKVVGLINEKR